MLLERFFEDSAFCRCQQKCYTLLPADKTVPGFPSPKCLSPQKPSESFSSSSARDHTLPFFEYAIYMQIKPVAAESFEIEGSHDDGETLSSLKTANYRHRHSVCLLLSVVSFHSDAIKSQHSMQRRLNECQDSSNGHLMFSVYGFPRLTPFSLSIVSTMSTHNHF